MEQDALTALILEIFRLNGQLLMAGDALVADLGLTSARWQVLGALTLSPVPLPVAHIARNMGLTRQAVQRLVNELARADMLRFAANPHHQRAKLVLLAPRGAAAYEAAMRQYSPWVKDLARTLSIPEIEQATATLRAFRCRLEGAPEGEPDDA